MIIMSFRRSEDESLATGVTEKNFWEGMALRLGLKRWRETGEGGGISVTRTDMNKVKKVPSHAEGSMWCHMVDGADEMC